MESNSEYYLRRAAQASALAELTQDGRVKAIDLKMARNYLALSGKSIEIKIEGATA